MFGLLPARAVLQHGLVRSTNVEDIRLTVLSSLPQLREGRAGSQGRLYHVPCTLGSVPTRGVGELVVRSFPLLHAKKLVSPMPLREYTGLAVST